VKRSPLDDARATTPSRVLTAAIACAAAAALLLTACGSENDSSSDKVKRTDARSENSSPSAPASASKRPVIKLPHTFTADFAGWTSNNPKLQTALNDGKERLRASYAAIIAGDANFSALSFYSVTSAMSTGSTWVKGYKGLTITGEVRVYNPEIAYIGKSRTRATLSYCVDESKGSSEDLKTGEKSGTPKGESPTVQYRTSLARQTGGIWKTATVETQPGGC